jgi:hypothetical protein
MVTGKHFFTAPNCGNVLWAVLHCNAQGYFCCDGQGGAPTTRCNGQNETAATCMTDPLNGGPTNQTLIQPGGCYVDGP